MDTARTIETLLKRFIVHGRGEPDVFIASVLLQVDIHVPCDMYGHTLERRESMYSTTVPVRSFFLFLFSSHMFRGSTMGSVHGP